MARGLFDRDPVIEIASNTFRFCRLELSKNGSVFVFTTIRARS